MRRVQDRPRVHQVRAPVSQVACRLAEIPSETEAINMRTIKVEDRMREGFQDCITRAGMVDSVERWQWYLNWSFDYAKTLAKRRNEPIPTSLNDWLNQEIIVYDGKTS